MKAAEVATDATNDEPDEIFTPLCAAESDACTELAKMPCANDAEFIEKLKCLCARHVRIYGPLTGDENEPVIIAIAIHMAVDFKIYDGQTGTWIPA